MNRHIFLRVALAGVLSGSALPLVQCTKTPTPVGAANDKGGDEGPGPVKSDADISSQDPSDAAVAVNLDVPPVIWGLSDAPQGPEVVATPSIDSNCGLIASKLDDGKHRGGLLLHPRGSGAHGAGL